MKLNNKGMSMTEIMASVALISIVLIFLMNIFLKIRTIYNQSAIDSEYEVLRSNIINAVGSDISEYGLKRVSCVNSSNTALATKNCNRVKLEFNSFRETELSSNIAKILKTYSIDGTYYISYGYDSSLTDNITSAEKVTNVVRKIPDNVVIENYNMINIIEMSGYDFKEINIPLYDDRGNIYSINIYGITSE